ncbi:MAG: hypothetical protein WC631_00655 [Candidatus Paceibacterota bacterium]|jgi:hypothetical protein
MKIALYIVGIMLGVAILYLTSKSWKKVLRILAGYGLYSCWTWVCDNPIWLGVIGYFSYHFGNVKGIVIGSIVMTISAFINNFIFLVWYQRKEVDWLGVDAFETLSKKTRDRTDKWFVKARARDHRDLYSLSIRILIWLGTFFLLTIVEDSFVATTILRGRVGGRLSGKDYTVFVLSTLVGCIYWSARNGVLFGVAKAGFVWIWKLLT